MNILEEGCKRLNLPKGRPKPGGVVREDMKFVVRKEDEEDVEGWRRKICCGNYREKAKKEEFR